MEVDLASRILDRIFASTHMLVAYLDRDFNFVRVNEAYVRTSRQEDPRWFEGKNHFELFPHAENEAIFRRVVETGESFTVKSKPFEHPDQPERKTTYWDWTLDPVRGHDGQVEGVLLCIVDVSDQTRALEAHRHGELQYRSLLDQFPDGLCVVRRDQIVCANAALGALLGRPPAELVGARLTELVHGPDAGQLWIGPRFVTDEAVSAFSVQLRRSDGHLVRVDGSSRIIEYEGQGGVLHVFRDRSTEERLERDLSRARRLELLGRLAGGVAHDFNNLLTVLAINLGGLAPGAAPSSRERMALEDMQLAIESSSGLTRQLLAFSRQQLVLPQPTGLHELVRGVAGLLRSVLPENVTVRYDLRASRDVVLVDRAQMEQVVANLLVNARDAMPTGGCIEVTTGDASTEALGHGRALDPGTALVLRVRDTGVGMNRETVAHVFDPFFSTKDPGVGTGLGLAIVEGVIERCGGRVTVTSEPGVGTEFAVFLPLHQDDASAERSPAAPDPSSLVGSGTVLLVEDDAPVRRAVRCALETYGYTVLDTGEKDGARALADQHSGPIDILVTDLLLRGATGVEVIEELRSRRPSLPALLMTGYSADGTLAGVSLPADLEVLAKPFSPHELAAKVRSVLARSGPPRPIAALV